MSTRGVNMRYAAKLLFQYRVDVGGDTGKVRTVEERIILIPARNAELALKKANKRGRSGETSYLNDDGNRVFIEFIGVADLMHLGAECEDDTVWYEIKTMVNPMERKQQLIPAPKELSAIKFERKQKVV